MQCYELGPSGVKPVGVEARIAQGFNVSAVGAVSVEGALLDGASEMPTPLTPAEQAFIDAGLCDEAYLREYAGVSTL